MGAESDRGDLRTTHHFVDEHIIHERQATTTDLLRMAKCPKPLCLGFVHESTQNIATPRADPVGHQLAFDRIHLLLYEVEYLVPNRTHVLGYG